ncbi:hypothetical protein C3941_19660 [Kaistia algarum]|uniref:hypothetical protein n=1 Tax=Kaistia algarum TaxID=2083279 RepID=UPI000CE8F0BC|nr:hypothetical protein [Kaistia algarum]MCX5516208.1 hypothetical protein [Kaistia algarum]PPE78283.1 hypothetical protein C3941_19660 [Kaistia algarum]
MSTITDAIDLIVVERDAKAAEIQLLTSQVSGLDTAIAALQAICLRGDKTKLPFRPAGDQQEERAGEQDTPAASIGQGDAPASPVEGAPKTMASIVAAVDTQPAAVGAVSAGEALATLILNDMPALMTRFRHGPNARDLMLEYGADGNRVRDACRRLHNSGRALFAVNEETGTLHLTPRQQKSAA